MLPNYISKSKQKCNAEIVMELIRAKSQTRIMLRNIKMGEYFNKYFENKIGAVCAHAAGLSYSSSHSNFRSTDQL
jgi:hypothetical protein